MEKNIQLFRHSQIISCKKGFTLTEILVILGVVSVVVLGNVTFMSTFLREIDKYEKESMDESELAVLNNLAMNLFKKASLSFNVVSLPDDGNLNFYDYYPDVPLGSVRDESREYSITGPSDSKFFYLVASEEDLFSSMVFDPVHAYSVQPPDPSLQTDTPISYTGINSVPMLRDSTGNAATHKMMSQIFGDRWSNGKFFIITCPTYLRTRSAVTVDITTVPRLPSFFGQVAGDSLDVVSNSTIGFTVLNSNPVTGAAYASPDTFLRTLPTVGGAAAFVKIEPVVVKRFELRRNIASPAGMGDLILSTFEASGYGTEVTVATNIRSVTFKRKSVALPLISLEIKK